MDNEELIAKVNKNNLGENDADALPARPEANCEADESGETNCDETMLGNVNRRMAMPGNEFRSEMIASTNTNVWLAPLVCTSILSGVIVVATAVICILMYKFTHKKKDA